MRRHLIAVIGSGDLSSDSDEYRSAVIIGRILIDRGYRLVTGGLGGVMEAASMGAHLSERYSDGSVIGILPGYDPSSANQYVDIAIPSGLGIGRNMLVTNADAIIAVGGGSGTLSELAFAWQKGKLIIALDFPGWSGRLGGERVDDRVRHRDIPDDRIYTAASAEDAVRQLDEMLPIYIRTSKNGN
ncbi:MAG: TIGR00725 family protein [Thermoplasmatota archaeon]